MRNHKKFFFWKGLKIFHFDKSPQGWDEVKNSIGLLQGPRLMAWTTKSPIQRNHWVPLGCRAILGSVKHNCRKVLAHKVQ